MIFTFYSYKGGVGRTHLLANMAAYLCHYQNRKVLMIDWDLEAPGLHFYFEEKDKDVQKLGIVDLMLQFEEQRKTATEKNPLKEEDLFFPNEDYIHNIVSNENGGKIDLLPATKYEKDYHHKIDSFDWLDFYENKEGYVYLSWLKEQLKKRSHYDYVFIDSRTGLNDYSGICNVLMPDMNIILVAPNDQNFAGAKTMADRIIHSPYTESNARKPFILPILSRLDTSSPDADEWRTKFAKTFAFLIDELDDDIKAFKEEILEQVSALTVLEYTPKFATGEKTHFKEEATRIVAGSALENFENIALLFLEKMNEKGEINLNEFVGDKMIPFYMRKIKENPEDYEAYFGLGYAYYGLENYEEARKSYQKAIEIKPNYHGAWSNLGIIYNDQKDYAAAITAYQKAIEIKPDLHEAWNNLGTTHLNQKDYAAAFTAYQKAIEIEPDYHEAWYNLGITYNNQKDYAAAITAYQKAIEIKPDLHQAWYHLGATYKELKNYDLAIKNYEKAIEIKPDFHAAWSNLGFVYRDKQNYEKAMTYFNKAIEINAEYSEMYKVRGSLLLLLGKQEEAIQDMQKAYELNPNDPELLYFKQQEQKVNEDLETGEDFLLYVMNQLNNIEQIDEMEEGKAMAYLEDIIQKAEKAIELLDNITQLLQAYLYKATIYAILQDKDNFLKDIKIILEKVPNKEGIKQGIKIQFKDFEWLWQDEDFLKLVEEEK